MPTLHRQGHLVPSGLRAHHFRRLTQSEANEIAAELGVKPEEVLEMETRISGGDVSLDPTPGDEDAVTPIAYLTDADDEPAEILERRETDRQPQSRVANGDGATRRPQPPDHRSALAPR